MVAASPAYWLVKSEPHSFAWADLLASPSQTTPWDGVRNFQARNFLRDGFGLGDLVFFYQSSCAQLGVVGLMRVTRTAYPDPSQFDARSAYYDAKSPAQAPRWLAVDLQAAATFAAVVARQALRREPTWAALPLFAPHSRLSVMPVPKAAARRLLALAGSPIAQ